MRRASAATRRVTSDGGSSADGRICVERQAADSSALRSVSVIRRPTTARFSLFPTRFHKKRVATLSRHLLRVAASASSPILHILLLVLFQLLLGWRLSPLPVHLGAPVGQVGVVADRAMAHCAPRQEGHNLFFLLRHMRAQSADSVAVASLRRSCYRALKKASHAFWNTRSSIPRCCGPTVISK